MAVGEAAERRAAERAVVDNMKEAYVSVLAPSQLGVGISAGDSVLIHDFDIISDLKEVNCRVTDGKFDLFWKHLAELIEDRTRVPDMRWGV
eukprot:jgi/Tetstr1/439803/TSEL_028215.t1